MRLASLNRQETRPFNLTMAPPKNAKEAEFRKMFNDKFSADAFDQYRGASSWEVAYDAASHIGGIDAKDYVTVINSSRRARYGQSLRDPAEDRSAVHETNLYGLGVDAAREFYFKSMNVKLNYKQAEILMHCDLETLMLSIDYYTFPLPFRCLATCLGRAPKLGLSAYIGEYFRRGLDPEYWVFQDMLRKL